MQIYPDILGTDAVSDSRQMIIDRENSIKSSFSGPRAPTVTAEDVGCIWYCTADSNFYGLYSIDEDGSNPAWHKLVTPTKLNAMDLGTPTTETLYVDLEGAPCEAKKDMFVLVEHTILPVENYEITNNGMRVTFVSPIPAGLKLEIRWFVQEVIGRDGATFVPSIVNNVLTWDNDQGLVNPPDLDFNANLTEIENFANEQIVAIKDSSDAEIVKINNTGSTQVATVQSNGASQVNLIKQTAQEYINTMDDKATEASNSATEAAESAEAAAASAASIDSDNIVHKTGSETIGGSKTFTSTINMQSGNDMSYVVRSINADNTQQTQEVQTLGAFRNVDKNGKIIGDVRFARGTNGTVTSSMVARNYASDANGVNAVISCSVDKDGTVFTSAPTPATNDSSTKIATTANVDAKITAQAVKLSGNQTVGGVKTFTSQPITLTSGGDCRFYSKTSAYAQGTAPANDIYGGYRFLDKNGVEIATCYGKISTNNVSSCHLWVKSPVAGSTSSNSVGINCDANGNFYTYAPTPATSDNSTKIATTAFVKNQGYVASSSLTACQVVTQTYVSGTNWYRVYSDGWIEQGGRVSISQDAQTTVTLLKAFSNTNYTALISACRTGMQTGGDGNFSVEYVSASQFKWSNGDDFGGTGIWYACGY